MRGIVASSAERRAKNRRAWAPHADTRVEGTHIVRWDKDSGPVSSPRARYRLKHPREIRQMLRALSEFIDSASPSRQ